MTDLTISMDVKTLVFVLALVCGGAFAWATIKADTADARKCAQAAEARALDANARLAAIERQLVELTVTLRLKGVTP